MSYTTTQIQDDDDLDGAFDMIQVTPTVTSIELCTTYNSGTIPSQPNSLKHFHAHDPQPNTQASQEPFDLNTTYLPNYKLVYPPPTFFNHPHNTTPKCCLL